MRKFNLFLIIALLGGMIFSGFQCGSSELESAKLYIKNKDYEKAIIALKEEVTKRPNSAYGWYLLGNVYGELDNMDSLLIAYKKSLAASNEYEANISNSINYHWANAFNSGVNLFQRGNSVQDDDSSMIYYDKSIEAFKNAAKLQPDSSDAYKNMAFVYMNSGRREEAIEPFEKLIEIKQELDGYRYLGEIYYSLAIQKKSTFGVTSNMQDSIDSYQNFTNAIDILQEGKKLYPDDDEITRLLNASYVETGRIDEALESAKQLVDKDPQNETYRYNYGVLLLQTENYEAAEGQLMSAIEIKPDYDNAIYNLAVTYVKWGTQMSKEEEESENYTGEYKIKYEKALPYLENVVDVDPENADIWELLGKVYSILGMQDKAMDAYNRADQLR